MSTSKKPSRIRSDIEEQILLQSSSSASSSRNFAVHSGEVDWGQAICTLLPSRRSTRGRKRASICPPLPPKIVHAITLPRWISSKESAVCLEMEEDRKPSFEVTEALDFLDVTVDDDSEHVEASQEDYREQLKVVCSLPVPMTIKREYRTKLQKMSGTTPAKGEIRMESQKQMHLKIRETYDEVFSRWQLWSRPLKVIEGQYGTGVVSYFIFLRWLLFLNLFIFLAVLIFIILPQTFFLSSQDAKSQLHTSSSNSSGNFLHDSTRPPASYAGQTTVSPQIHNKNVPQHDFSSVTDINALSFLTDYFHNASLEQKVKLSQFCHRNYTEQIKEHKHLKFIGFHHIQHFLQGTGWLELTLMFTGFYDSYGHKVFATEYSYNMPVAFLIVTIIYFAICLAMMINYTSEGVRETLLVDEGFITKYCNMIFSGWDFCIEDQKTAKLKHYSIMQEIKTNLAEEHRLAEIAERSTQRKVTIVIIRIAANIAVLGVLIGSFFLLKFVAEESLIETQDHAIGGGFHNLIFQYLPSLTLTILNMILPMIFTQIIKLEKYSKAYQIKLSLVRTVFLRLASIGMLVTSFYNLILCPPDKLTPCLQGHFGEADCNRPLCWETYVGQQMYKLVIMDFIVMVFTTFFIETPRRLFVTKFQVKLAKLIGNQEFDIPCQVLAMVYSQALCWLGAFYSPMIPAICVLKQIILFYVKKFTLLRNCVPSNIPYRASRSNTFFMIVLMINFMVAVVIVGYSISEVPPSRGCGPFRLYDSMFSSLSETINTSWPELARSIVNFLLSAGFALPAFSFLCFAMYYYITLASAHQKLTEILKDHLLLEGKDKQFLLTRLNDVARQREEPKID